jgi:hypothetical protein
MGIQGDRRSLSDVVKAVCWSLIILVLVGMAAIAVGVTAHVTSWMASDGKHVNIPWTNDSRPRLTPAEKAAENVRRTRDGSRFLHRKDCNCSLVFWKIAPESGVDAHIINLLAGFNGCTHVVIDCCVSDSTGPWMIESSQDDTDKGVIDGPQYTPLRYWQGRPYARAFIGGLIDCERLREDLVSVISNSKVRHKTGAYWMDYAFGRTDPNVVTCSSLSGQCILRQPSSSLAVALRRAMRERITYGELTPNDLARAIAMVQAPALTLGASRFTRVPILGALLNCTHQEGK